jgi:hypothetical protein
VTHSPYHGCQFRFSRGFAVDLHWSPLSDCCSPDLAARFLATARRASFGGLAIRVPSPPHLLLHACVHAAKRDWLMPGRSVLDAACLVQDTPDLDWALLWDTARTAGVEHAVDVVLRSLDAVVGLPPGWNRHRRLTRASLADRIELWGWRRDGLSFRNTPVARVITHLSRYRRLRRYHPAWRHRGPTAYWRLYRAEREQIARTASPGRG